MAEPIPVILSGGAGTRLWPLSREEYPKQLHRLNSEHSLLQETAGRWPGRPIVVCNHEHRFIVAEQLRAIGTEPRAIVIEPVGRNTAPAATVAALLAETDPEALLLVMPSDHLVKDVEAFRAAVARAIPLAEQGLLVTFGVTPTRPHTGYGYIQRGPAVGEGFAVTRFVEKPDRAAAETYLAAGDHLWNSGIFLFQARLWLDELGRRHPDMVTACRGAVSGGSSDLFFFRLGAAFAAIRPDSIDVAVMETTHRAAVVPVDMGWSDVGSWSAVWGEGSQDADGNVAIGDVMTVATRNSYLHSEGRLVAALGVENMVVVATDDAVLVADKAHDQDVRRLVERLKAEKRPEAVRGKRTWRPWGWFQTVDDGNRFRVKHIHVNPSARLSLQKHWHRSEHWVVVTGTALVTRNDKTFVLRENESTFIPAGAVHRLENPGKMPLRMIEVQSGEYVGEDDIVRLEDTYGRTGDG
ncbi:MAG: mannose-1-phosphate guanylyltransferase/mannose-6-phosphate isomerase [Solirubrobacterales bacterium]